jgi:hypothetical protein
MDLSKVPDLELRQKIKPLSERLQAVKRQIDRERSREMDKLEAVIGPLRSERDRLRVEIEAALDDHPDASEVIGACLISGLPIFDSDEIEESYALACLANGAGK